MGCSESAAAGFEYARSGELKISPHKRGKIGVFFADTFGAYAKVLSLHSITILSPSGLKVNDIN